MGVGGDGDAVVVEVGPVPGLGAVGALAGLAGHDAAEPQRPPGDGADARLLRGELEADGLAVVDEDEPGLGQVGCLLEQVGGADRQDADRQRRQLGQRRARPSGRRCGCWS